MWANSSLCTGGLICRVYKSKKNGECSECSSTASNHQPRNDLSLKNDAYTDQLRRIGATIVNSGMFTCMVEPSTTRSIRYVPAIFPIPDLRLHPETYWCDCPGSITGC